MMAVRRGAERGGPKGSCQLLWPSEGLLACLHLRAELVLSQEREENHFLSFPFISSRFKTRQNKEKATQPSPTSQNLHHKAKASFATGSGGGGQLSGVRKDDGALALLDVLTHLTLPSTSSGLVMPQGSNPLLLAGLSRVHQARMTSPFLPSPLLQFSKLSCLALRGVV